MNLYTVTIKCLIILFYFSFKIMIKKEKKNREMCQMYIIKCALNLNRYTVTIM